MSLDRSGAQRMAPEVPDTHIKRSEVYTPRTSNPIEAEKKIASSLNFIDATLRSLWRWDLAIKLHGSIVMNSARFTVDEFADLQEALKKLIEPSLSTNGIFDIRTIEALDRALELGKWPELFDLLYTETTKPRTEIVIGGYNGNSIERQHESMQKLIEIFVEKGLTRSDAIEFIQTQFGNQTILDVFSKIINNSKTRSFFEIQLRELIDEKKSDIQRIIQWKTAHDPTLIAMGRLFDNHMTHWLKEIWKVDK